MFNLLLLACGEIEKFGGEPARRSGGGGVMSFLAVVWAERIGKDLQK